MPISLYVSTVSHNYRYSVLEYVTVLSIPLQHKIHKRSSYYLDSDTCVSRYTSDVELDESQAKLDNIKASRISNIILLRGLLACGRPRRLLTG